MYISILIFFSVAYWIIYRQTFIWLLHSWRYNSLYTHGYILISICCGLIIWNGFHIKKIHLCYKSSIGWFIGGIMIMLCGSMLKFPYLIACAYSACILAITILLAPSAQRKFLSIPILLMIFVYPLPFVHEAAGYLSYTTAAISAGVLKILFPGVIVKGIEIIIPPDIQFTIGSNCSGAHPIIALITILILWIVITNTSLLTSLYLIIIALPIGFIVNVMRITGIFLIAEFRGVEAALNAWHDYAGYFFYMVSLALCAAIWLLLHMHFTKKIRLREILIT